MADTNRGNSIAPAIAGMAIGAAVAAGAVILSDEKKRKQIMKKMNTAKDKATDMLQQARTKVNEFQSNTDDVLDDMTDESTEEQNIRKRIAVRRIH